MGELNHLRNIRRLEAMGSSEETQASQSEEENPLFGLLPASLDLHKKSRKKKKKNKEGPSSEASTEESVGEARSSIEPEQRYVDTLRGLQTGDDSFMWVDLSGCGIQDKKMVQLSKALQCNDHVISLNLSKNRIGEKGYESLVDILVQGALPNLIELILDNGMSKDTREVMEHLKRKRKQLIISFEGEDTEDPLVARLVSDTAGSLTETTESNVQRGKTMDYFSEPSNVFDEDVDNNFDTMPDGPKIILTRGEDAEDEAKKLWGNFLDIASEEILHASAMAIPLREISEGMQAEVEREVFGPGCNLSELTPRLRGATDVLGTLVYTLQRSPPDVRLASKTLVPAVGSHRVYIVRILANMLRARVNAIDTAIANTRVAIKVVQMFFEYENCNSFQLFASQFILLAFKSKVELLWKPMLAHPADLLDRLCKASNFLDIPISRRPPNIGHVVQLSKSLNEKFQSKHSTEVHDELMKNSDWRRFVTKTGALNAFLGEQEGCLGGTRPEPYRHEDSADGEGLDAMSSRELMALLSSLGAMRVSHG